MGENPLFIHEERDKDAIYRESLRKVNERIEWKNQWKNGKLNDIDKVHMKFIEDNKITDVRELDLVRKVFDSAKSVL